MCNSNGTADDANPPLGEIRCTAIGTVVVVVEHLDILTPLLATLPVGSLEGVTANPLHTAETPVFCEGWCAARGEHDLPFRLLRPGSEALRVDDSAENLHE